MYVHVPISILALKSVGAWGNSPWAIGVRFTPPNTKLGIVRYVASTNGRSCEASSSAPKASCLIKRLQAATRYDITAVACDENDFCSDPRYTSIMTLPDRKFLT